VWNNASFRRSDVHTGIGLLASMFALLLSLQISFGKTTFDTQEEDVTTGGDHRLSCLIACWLTTGLRPKMPANHCGKVPFGHRRNRKHQPGSPEPVYDKILSLFPKSEEQRSKNVGSRDGDRFSRKCTGKMRRRHGDPPHGR